MGSPCEVLVDSSHEQLAQAVTSAVAACAQRIEQKYSRYRHDSVLSRINRDAGAPTELESAGQRMMNVGNNGYTPLGQ